MEDDVAQQIDRTGYMLVQKGGVEHRVGLGCEGVEFSAHAFKRVDDVDGVAARRPFEGGVLAEVRQSFLSGQLVASTSRQLVAAIHYG